MVVHRALRWMLLFGQDEISWAVDLLGMALLQRSVAHLERIFLL